MKLIDSKRYLPIFMRDFHDQKDVFKCVAWWGKKSASNIDWVKAHCYVIDVFLEFMALHGYTLQKSRTDEETYNIDDTIAKRREKDIEVLKEVLS